MIYYHATSAANIPAIMRHGLEPRCEGCVGLNKNRPGVYMWGNYLNAHQYAKAHWNNELAAVIVVDIEPEYEHEYPIVRDPEYWSDEAFICPVTIAPGRLTPIKLGTSRVCEAIFAGAN